MIVAGVVRGVRAIGTVAVVVATAPVFVIRATQAEVVVMSCVRRTTTTTTPTRQTKVESVAMRMTTARTATTATKDECDNA